MSSKKYEKRVSKFKHFTLPKLPTSEDILKMFLDNSIEYSFTEYKILGYVTVLPFTD